MSQTDLEDYVNVDYFAVNNIEFTTDFDDSMVSLVDKEYVVVNNSNTDTDTMTEREDSIIHNVPPGLSNNNNNINGPHHALIADDTASTSDGGRSDTATSTQLLGLSLSAIQTKMDNKLQLKHLKNLKNINKDIQCHRKYEKMTKLYKWILLFCSIITFCIYGYYYYRYFHSNEFVGNNNTNRINSFKPMPPFINNEYDNVGGGINGGGINGDDNMDINHEDEGEAEYEYDFDVYEYRIQSNYYQYRYGYYHDYNKYEENNNNDIAQENYSIISYLWQMILFFILFIICFTSFQIFGLAETPEKDE